MTHRLVLVLGGVRSGKSRFAQSLAEQLGGDDVLFVATAQAGDDEMSRRINLHRRSRPATWQTFEQSLAVGEGILALEAPPRVILVDCLTLLVSNVMLQCDGDEERSYERVNQEAQALVRAAEHHSAAMIIVSGEVGAGVVPPTPMGRLFRDLLGLANQAIASHADQTYLTVAGLAVDVKALATSPEQAAGRFSTDGLRSTAVQKVQQW